MRHLAHDHPDISRDEILTRSLEAMADMIDLSQALAAAHGMDALMAIVRHGARQLTGADGASFILRDGEDCYYADEEAIQPLWKGRRFPMSECVSGWVMQHHEPVVIPDIYMDDRVPHEIYAPTFVHGMAVVPIRTSNPLGAIGCYWSSPYEVSPFQLRLLQILSNMTAVVMENIQHELELANRATLLEKAFEGTLLSISKMIDLRDTYTAGHQRRVGEISRHIGQAMGFSPEHCQALNWAGFIHDAGKIGVPAEILTKPTKLSDIEFKLVQSHSEIGCELLKEVKMPYPIAEVVLQHHEHMDGSGYPKGLRGEDILMDARILAVADVFEAMVSHRPYRAALGYEAALAELAAHRNTKYDAQVVDCLTRLVLQEGYQIPE